MGDSLPAINVDQLTLSVNTAIHGNLPPLPPLPPYPRGWTLSGGGGGGTARGGEGGATGSLTRAVPAVVVSSVSCCVSGFNSQPAFSPVAQSVHGSDSSVVPRLPSADRTSTTPLTHHDRTIPTTTIITILPSSAFTDTTTTTTTTTTITGTAVGYIARAENTVPNNVPAFSTTCQSSPATVTITSHGLSHPVPPLSSALPVTADMSFMPPVSVVAKSSITGSSLPTQPQASFIVTGQGGGSVPLSQPQGVGTVGQGSACAALAAPLPVPPHPPARSAGGSGPLFIMLSVRLPTPDSAGEQASKSEAVTPSPTTPVPPPRLHHLPPLPLLLPLLPPPPPQHPPPPPPAPSSTVSFCGPAAPGALPLLSVPAPTPVPPLPLQFPSSLSLLPTTLPQQAPHSDLPLPSLLVQREVGGGGAVSMPAYLPSPVSSVKFFSCAPPPPPLPPTCLLSPSASQGQVTLACPLTSAFVQSSVPLTTTVSASSCAMLRVPYGGGGGGGPSVSCVSSGVGSVPAIFQRPLSAYEGGPTQAGVTSVQSSSVWTSAGRSSHVTTGMFSPLAGSCPPSQAFPPPGFSPLLTSPSLTRLLLLPPVPVAAGMSDAGFLPPLPVLPGSSTGLCPAPPSQGVRDGGDALMAHPHPHPMERKESGSALSALPVLSNDSPVLLGNVGRETSQAAERVRLAGQPAPESSSSAPASHPMSAILPASAERGRGVCGDDLEREAWKSVPAEDEEARLSVDEGCDAEGAGETQAVIGAGQEEAGGATLVREVDRADPEESAAGSSAASCVSCQGDGVTATPVLVRVRQDGSQLCPVSCQASTVTTPAPCCQSSVLCAPRPTSLLSSILADPPLVQSFPGLPPALNVLATSLAAAQAFAPPPPAQIHRLLNHDSERTKTSFCVEMSDGKESSSLVHRENLAQDSPGHPQFMVTSHVVRSGSDSFVSAPDSAVMADASFKRGNVQGPLTMCAGQSIVEKPVFDGLTSTLKNVSLRLHHPPPSYPSGGQATSLDLPPLPSEVSEVRSCPSQLQGRVRLPSPHHHILQDASVLTEDIPRGCPPVSFGDSQHDSAAVQVRGSQVVRLLPMSSGSKIPGCDRPDPATRLSSQSSVLQLHPCQFSTRGIYQQQVTLAPGASTTGGHACPFSVGSTAVVTESALLPPASISVPSAAASVQPVPVSVPSVLPVPISVPSVLPVPISVPSVLPVSVCVSASVPTSVSLVCASVAPLSVPSVPPVSVPHIHAPLLPAVASVPYVSTSVPLVSASVPLVSTSVQSSPALVSASAPVLQPCAHRVDACQLPGREADGASLPSLCCMHHLAEAGQFSVGHASPRVRALPAAPPSHNRADCQFSDHTAQLTLHHPLLPPFPPPSTTTTLPPFPPTLTHFSFTSSSSSTTTSNVPTTLSTDYHHHPPSNLLPPASVGSGQQTGRLPGTHPCPPGVVAVLPPSHTLLPSVGYSPPGLSNQGLSPHLLTPLGLGGMDQPQPAPVPLFTDHQAVVQGEGCIGGVGDALGLTAAPASELDLLLLKTDNMATIPKASGEITSISRYTVGKAERQTAESLDVHGRVQTTAESAKAVALKPCVVTHDTMQHSEACVGDMVPTGLAGVPDSAAATCVSSDMAAFPVFTGQFCLECCRVCVEECGHGGGGHTHQVRDSMVLSRARATLPDCLYLAPSLVTGHCNNTGVFARRALSMRTEFGPLQGQVLPPGDSSERASFSQWKIFYQGFVRTVDASDENCSNWLMFIKPAPSATERNLVAFQRGHDLVMVTVKDVQPDQELCFWFAPDYGKMALATPRPPQFCPSCSVCSRVFLHRSELRAHGKEAHQQAPLRSWPCLACDAVFPSGGKLKEHKAAQHLKVKAHACPTCGKMFNDARNLRAHRHIHTGLRRFGCEVCGKHFTQKAHLQSHQSTHTKVKAVACRFCDKLFVRKSDMRQHELTHTQEKALSCQQCSRVFQKPRLLRRHLRSVHNNERNYMCERCSKTFHTKYKLTRHAHSCKTGQTLPAS